ncbi:MAG: RNA-directed DNA polymerase [Sphaerochaeta sp.]|nr:RNA-directed DNA polymerase [Sphaerochaeta sp.]
MEIKIQDLMYAYKKVKVDLFYSNCENYASLLQYEHDLEKNLLNLKNKIEQYAENPKPLDYINSDSSYSLIGKEYDSVKGITLRVMSNFPIEFHVLSSLWIQKIGFKIDAEFDDSMIWGNRLRRCADGEPNKMALGNFKPYSGQYHHWQDNAIKAIQCSLEADIDVSVFSTDAKAFYHSISPRVLKDKKLDKYTVGFENLHAMFSDAIIEWSENPKAIFLQPKNGKHLGIPVGLSASCVIANWVLRDLDQEIAETIRPLSYGRYVDDILLVVPANKGDKTRHSFSQWLLDRIEALKFCPKEDGSGEYLQFTWKPAIGSVDIPNITISFDNGKEQYQEFSGERGKAGLGIFIRQIQERTSEWRALPELPTSKSKVIGRLLEVTDAKMVPSQTLGSYTKISVVKSRFAFLLRDLESCLRIFPPDAWKEQRIAFLEAFATYLITPEEFFTYEKYLYRVLALGVVCLDYTAISNLLSKFEKLIKEFADSDKPCKLAGFLNLSSKMDPKNCHALLLYAQTIRGNVRDLFYRGNPNFDIDTFIDTFSRDFLEARVSVN